MSLITCTKTHTSNLVVGIVYLTPIAVYLLVDPSNKQCKTMCLGGRWHFKNNIGVDKVLTTIRQIIGNHVGITWSCFWDILSRRRHRVFLCFWRRYIYNCPLILITQYSVLLSKTSFKIWVTMRYNRSRYRTRYHCFAGKNIRKNKSSEKNCPFYFIRLTSLSYN